MSPAARRRRASLSLSISSGIIRLLSHSLSLSLTPASLSLTPCWVGEGSRIPRFLCGVRFFPWRRRRRAAPARHRGASTRTNSTDLWPSAIPAIQPAVRFGTHRDPPTLAMIESFSAFHDQFRERAVYFASVSVLLPFFLLARRLLLVHCADSDTPCFDQTFRVKRK